MLLKAVIFPKSKQPRAGVLKAFEIFKDEKVRPQLSDGQRVSLCWTAAPGEEHCLQSRDTALPRAVLTLPSLQGLPQVSFKACEEPSSALKAQKGGKQLRELCVCALEDQRAQSI